MSFSNQRRTTGGRSGSQRPSIGSTREKSPSSSGEKGTTGTSEKVSPNSVPRQRATSNVTVRAPSAVFGGARKTQPGDSNRRTPERRGGETSLAQKETSAKSPVRQTGQPATKCKKDHEHKPTGMFKGPAQSGKQRSSLTRIRTPTTPSAMSDPEMVSLPLSKEGVMTGETESKRTEEREVQDELSRIDQTDAAPDTGFIHDSEGSNEGRNSILLHSEIRAIPWVTQDAERVNIRKNVEPTDTNKSQNSSGLDKLTEAINRMVEKSDQTNEMLGCIKKEMETMTFLSRRNGHKLGLIYKSQERSTSRGASWSIQSIEKNPRGHSTTPQSETRDQPTGRSGRSPTLGLGAGPESRARVNPFSLVEDEPALDEESRPQTPLEYIDEDQEEEPYISFFNRRPTGITRTGDAEKNVNDSRAFESPSKRSALASVAEETKVNLPVEEEKFEEQVLAEKLELTQKGRATGSLFSQKPYESESSYHARLYQEARSRVRSEIRASMAGRRDVRFDKHREVNRTRENEENNSSQEHQERAHSITQQRCERQPESRQKERNVLNNRRRTRQSLLLHDIPELDEPLMPGVRTLLDRPLEKTDILVIKIVEDTTEACISRGEEINLHKLGFKFTLPEYSGSDTLESFLRFAKEATKCLSLSRLLKPGNAGIQTDVLGQMLKGKAQTWYQHTIGNNTNQETSLAEALVAMKRYFIKDASSRDAAAKFDRLKQGSRTVVELFRELERISMQMVETPSSYDSKCRFMSALNRETAIEVTRMGFTPETRAREELLQAARQVEQSQFYIEREDQESSKQTKQKGAKAQNTRYMGLKPRPDAEKDASKEKPKGPSRQNFEKTICHNCHKAGHIAARCPQRTQQTTKAARAARDVMEEDELGERAAEIREESERSSLGLEETLSEESDSDGGCYSCDIGRY